jgi:hypothetical protein
MAEENNATAEHEEIHLPPPSFAPIIVAAGATLLLTGLLAPALLILGVVVLLAGIGVWAFGQ